MIIVLKTFFGLEQVLADELLELGYPNSKLLNRAVQIEGSWKDVYFLNLHIRCAISVLVELHSFTIKNEDDLYTEASKIAWTGLFDAKKTFAVKGAVNSTFFKHSQFPFLLVKDAIVDVFRQETGERPDVNVKTPQLVIDLYVSENKGVISVNTSGMPLFQRGYRQHTGEAPLNEVVAAALLRLSGWDKKTTLVDPFCGSGTLLIEAALLACGIPSNVERTHYAFKNLKNFDANLWQEIRDSIPKYPKNLPCKIVGSDINEQMVLKTRRNLNGFPFGREIETQVASVGEVDFPEAPALMISNPPYGERLEADIEELYNTIGTVMKHQLQGYSCFIISSNKESFHAIGLKDSKRFKVFNGNLECSFRKYEIYAGSKKEKQLNEPQ